MFCEEDARLQFAVVIAIVGRGVQDCAGDKVVPFWPGGGVEEGREDSGGGGVDGGCRADGEGRRGLGAPVGSR